MNIIDLDGIVIVTGTDTDAGKTVTTAVIAAALKQAGKDVLIIKPYQTGLAPEEPGDVHEAGRLSGVDADNLLEYVRCPEPLAPTTSAARAGMTIPSIEEVATCIIIDSDGHDVTLVEGAGGVLVGLDNDGAGVLDLMDALARRGHEPHIIVATRSVLGTLNHTGLTCNAIRDRGHLVDAIVIGSWPAEPDLAERCNLEEIEDAATAPLAGVIPAGIGKDPEAVQQTARNLGGI
ncbi:dethiobiotin synthase [Propionibacterium sp. NM47_B9-13]|jgi:dethiobiotin synthetase|uniref:ATP-dependent dethiobiotin synthetase BioD n=2 Tax=Cutibacterium modestum TaxID=2559073 RepID=A0AAD1NVP2_9ACTN|nr:dethiobiotin synthase [Cutibacterium modestum]TGY29459.1 dethiobiotin synthase [Propionibacterium sp. NM47_B9-13]AOH44776.1 dethiobiotin synthase [Cutibacterium modestum]EFS74943.1 dethiobiotin synthase [Cutibacterium modestum HL037PA2]EFS91584.1 dethiobiotin synthase [Cutibacterium modestum HL044PA1]EFT16098.1 dethiobiotin synthase [Cutibacterium modestum HL037PA3]